MNKKNLRILTYAIFIIFSFVFLFYFNVVVKLILFSVVFAYILHPLVSLLSTKGMNKKYAAILVIIISSIIGLLFVFIVVPGMMVDLIQSSSGIKGLERKLNNYFEIIDKNNASPFVIQLLDSIAARFQEAAIGSVNTAIKQIINLGMVIPTYILAPIFVYYFLVEPEWFLNFFSRFIPFHIRDKFNELLRDIDNIVGGFVKSQIVLSIIVAVLTYAVLIIFGVKYPFIIALINGITNVIPYFGPVIGIVPAFFAALSGSIGKALIVTMILLLIQQFESSVVSPKLVGESIDMHPVFVMIVLLIGGELFGFWGLIFSVPIGGALRVTYKYIYRNLF